MASQMSMMAVLVPWATLKDTAVEVTDDCTLPKHYQFRQWGGACDYSWNEMKQLHHSNDFVMIHSLTKIRVFTIICVVLLNICLCCQKRNQIISVINVIVFVLSMMATTMYFTEENTTMTIPVRMLRLQGPGFWAQVLTGSLSLSVVLIDFYVTYNI
jgi:uncharacterized membrane protein